MNGLKRFARVNFLALRQTSPTINIFSPTPGCVCMGAPRTTGVVGVARWMPAILNPRPGVNPEGWPIREADLLPYMHRAMETCQLSDYVFDDPQYWIERFKQAQPSKELAILEPDATIQTVNWQVMDDQFLKFHSAYGQALEASRNLTIIRDATVQQLETNEAVSQVVSARAKNSSRGSTPDQRQAGQGSLEVRARQFVVAAGGIESVRLLLLSNQQQKEGLGNQSGLVGKYFMTHPIYLEAATYSGQGFPQPVRDFFKYNSVPGASFKVFAGLKPTAEFLRKTQSASWRVCFLGDGHQLNLNWEQIPNENSTISLGDEVDVFGQPKVKVNWEMTTQDKQTIAHALNQTRKYLVKRGVADPEGWQNLVNIELDQPWTETLAAAGHHLGGCRMSSDPKRGVVDGALRSHQLSNLSICSTAVFPSGGVSNPTLTLVALAHRLADRLRDNFA